MELLGVYYTILDTGGLGADGFTVINNRLTIRRKRVIIDIG